MRVRIGAPRAILMRVGANGGGSSGVGGRNAAPLTGGSTVKWVYNGRTAGFRARGREDGLKWTRTEVGDVGPDRRQACWKSE